MNRSAEWTSHLEILAVALVTYTLIPIFHLRCCTSVRGASISVQLRLLRDAKTAGCSMWQTGFQDKGPSISLLASRC